VVRRSNKQLRCGDVKMPVSITAAEIVEALRRLGLRDGDTVLVHSSLSSIGWVEGGADAVIDALLEAVGPSGTVIVPTITADPKHGPDNPPVFDVRSTPCWTGRIPETFRKRPEAVRSLHPTHSVAAIGPTAEWLAAGHERSETPCGPNTPYGRLVQLRGKVLLIGVDHNRSTLFHHIEEEAKVPYHMQSRPVVARVVDQNGCEFETPPIYLHSWETPRDFNRVEPALISGGAELVGMVGRAPTRVVDAQLMVRIVLAELARDPNALLPVSYCAAGIGAGGGRVVVPIVRLKEGDGLPLPAYATPGSAGLDLRAAVDGPVTIPPGGFATIPTGFCIAIPPGFEGQVRPRSGLAAKHGITALNSPGTIDSDYRGPVNVILINHGPEPFTVNRGDRIAQLVISPFARVEWKETDALDDTERGQGGFGHTGL